MIIQTNVTSLAARTAVDRNQRQAEKGLAQMASGSRINKASDDAARLAMSKGLEMDIRSAGQANRNNLDAISVIQVAEGSFNEMSSLVTRMRELSIQAASDTISDNERVMMNREATQLRAEVDRISNSTKWNSQKLLTSKQDSFQFQIGTGKDQDSRLDVNLSDLDTSTAAIGIGTLNLSSKEGAQKSLGSIDEAHTSLGERRAKLGAIQNRLNSSIDSLSVSSQNKSFAKSQMLDTDYAIATADVVKNQVMTRAGVATTSQANQLPNVALKLL